MSTTSDQFPTEAAGLPEARAPEMVELADGDQFDLRIAPVAKRIGDSDRADARLQRLDPRARSSRCAEGVGDRGRRRERGRHGGHRSLARPAAGEPLRRHPRDAGADPGRRQLHRPGRVPRPRASTGTTRTSARTTARRWASTATSSSSPPTPTTGRRRTASSLLTLDDILLEDGKVAPFSRAETTHAAMGRFGDVLLVNGETDLSLDAQPGEVVRLYLTNTANTRVFKVALPGARMKLVGGDSGRVEHEELVEEVILAPSERVVVDVLFDQAGRADAGAPHPRADLSAGRDRVSERPRRAALGEQFEVLRTQRRHGRRAGADRRLPGGRARQDARVHRRDGHGRAEGPVVYACPMHPEVVSEEPGTARSAG